MYKGQDVNGPFGTMDSLVISPIPFLNRILSRRPSPYLASASSCNRTFYPVLFDPDSSSSADDYESALAAFVTHCRFVFRLIFWLLMMRIFILFSGIANIVCSDIQPVILIISLMTVALHWMLIFWIVPMRQKFFMKLLENGPDTTPSAMVVAATLLIRPKSALAWCWFLVDLTRNTKLFPKLLLPGMFWYCFTLKWDSDCDFSTPM